jgi:hypothetical protein
MLGVYGQRHIVGPRNSRAGSCQTAFACLRSPPQLNLTPLLERSSGHPTRWNAATPKAESCVKIEGKGYSFRPAEGAEATSARYKHLERPLRSGYLAATNSVATCATFSSPGRCSNLRTAQGKPFR